jgi:outer membrane protein OmpA-like peptidoglycan-associated protein/uncharacterized protein YegP (UPF0339 family)
MHDNYLNPSLYKSHNRNSNGFAKFEYEDEFYFAYIDENGKVILRSEGYKSESSRDNGIESVMKNMDADDHYKALKLENGTWVLSLKAANNQEIAQSCPVSSESAAKAFLPSERAKARAATLRMFSSKSTTSSSNTNNEDNYLICREYEARISDSQSSQYKDFIKFLHTNGQYYFAWIIDNTVAMRSEGYASKAARDNGIEAVIKNRDNKDRYKTEEAHGAHFVILKAGNNQEIARSCPKKSEEEVTSFIAIWSGLGGLTIASTSIDIPPVEHTEDPILEDQVIVDEKSEVNAPIIDTPIEVIDSPKLELVKKESPVLESFKSEKPIVHKALIDSEIPVIETPKVELPQEEVEKIEVEKYNLNETDFPISEVEAPTIMPSIPETNPIYTNNPNAFVEKDIKSSFKWLWWVLGIAAILAALYFITLKGCGKPREVDPASALKDSLEFESQIAIDTNFLLDESGLAAKSSWDSTLGELTEVVLPDQTKILVPINGAEKKLVDFLNSGCNGELKKTWFNMDRILFVSGSTRLNSVSHDQLNVLNKIFAAYPRTYFKIGGYTDNVGDSLSNVKLSGLRALSVERALQEKGMQDKRIRSEGYGPQHPICAENNTPDCKALNRRVSIRVDTCNVNVVR